MSTNTEMSYNYFFKSWFSRENAWHETIYLLFLGEMQQNKSWLADMKTDKSL